MNNETFVIPPDAKERLIEKHLQHYIASNIQNVLQNASLVLKGIEIPTAAGRIDILAIEPNRIAWIIETKIGTATRDAVAQLQSYMAAISDIEEYEDLDVKGILVAENFDNTCRYALRMVEDISPLKYSVAFLFSDPEDNSISKTTTNRTTDSWVIDIERKIFHPKNNTRNVFPMSDRQLVTGLLASNDIELLTEKFSVGKYRKIK